MRGDRNKENPARRKLSGRPPARMRETDFTLREKEDEEHKVQDQKQNEIEQRAATELDVTQLTKAGGRDGRKRKGKKEERWLKEKEIQKNGIKTNLSPQKVT